MNQKSFSPGDFIKQAVDNFSWRSLLVILIIIAAILTRFINLGDRVMSHDEVNHVVPSYDFYVGLGYRHDPISHGPLQFHLMAFSYFLFGDNDFSSRIPHALASVASILVILFAYRKYYGKNGSLITAVLFLISPLLLFYGRYARNEALLMLLYVVILYTLMRYYEKKDVFSLTLITIVLALYYTAKETAYILTAILMLFLFFKMILQIYKTKLIPTLSFLANIVLILLIAASLGGSIFIFSNTDLSNIDNTSILLQSPEGQTLRMQLFFISESIKAILPGLIPLLVGLVLIYLLRSTLRWDTLSTIPSFNIFVLIVTLILPLLAAFPVRLSGFDPIGYTSPANNVLSIVYIVYLAFVSVILGFTWNSKIWWKQAVLFYAIFFLFYTSFFTNMVGGLTGIVGSLGYWLSQQDVNRGNQPWYYYAFLQLPFYEFLALIGSTFAVLFALFKRKQAESSESNNAIGMSSKETPDEGRIPTEKFPLYGFLLFWGVVSLIAYTIAGEKMPWLAVHIAIPFLFLTGKGLGDFIDSIRWSKQSSAKNWLGILFGLAFLVSLFGLVISLLGNNPPFQDKTQVQLQNTYQFLFQIGVLALLIYLQHRFFKDWSLRYKANILLLSLFLILAGITTQSAFRASFVNYDNPTEYLVYAHAAPGPKEILEQVETISRRITGGKDIQVAYDNHSLYPFWWYFRDYPNRIAYMENPTRSLESAPIILAGQANYGSVEPIIRNDYYTFEYYRLWWPNQDYYNLNSQRIMDMVSSADMRQAIYNIWLHRDYSLYREITNNGFLELNNWSPSEKMKMYIRKDIADQMWDFVSEEKLTQSPRQSDLDAITTILYPEYFIGGDSSPLDEPRGIDIAPDGTIYVADSKNNMIKHFSQSGSLLNSWGTFGSATDGDMQEGAFFEPWDVAVASNGDVYVSDTWNHRVQKFTAQGEYLSSWGYFAQGESPEGYWGPRGITVDAEGNVYIADTGNKRIMVFDQNDEFIMQIGSGGMDFGQFDEPVGIALDANGDLYVADTWNRRIQMIAPDLELETFTPMQSWDVEGWYGQSTNNKPFITVRDDGHVFITDPEGSIVMEFSSTGDMLQIWEIRAVLDETITLPVDIEFDANGTLWVSDANSNMIYGYTLN